MAFGASRLRAGKKGGQVYSVSKDGQSKDILVATVITVRVELKSTRQEEVKAAKFTADY